MNSKFDSQYLYAFLELYAIACKKGYVVVVVVYAIACKSILNFEKYFHHSLFGFEHIHK